jgi:hypothetical protein
MFAKMKQSMKGEEEVTNPMFKNINMGGTSQNMGANFQVAANKLANGELPSFTEESAFTKCCPNLTFKQRIYGFIACASFGWILSLMGTLTLIGGATKKNITIFAILFVIGNVIALCATGFLLGPKTQCNKMWAATRRYTTAFYLVMLIIVFSVAVAVGHLYEKYDPLLKIIYMCIYIYIYI